MSIDLMFDDYLEDKDIKPTAEVVPDDECQVFDADVFFRGEQLLSRQQKSASDADLEFARRTVDEILG